MPALQKTERASPSIGHLDTLSGVLREMAQVYRQARRGEIAISNATKLMFMLRCLIIIRDVIESQALADLDRRLTVLEHPLAALPGPGQERRDTLQ
jgi:hypothetical protein